MKHQFLLLCNICSVMLCSACMLYIYNMVLHAKDKKLTNEQIFVIRMYAEKYFNTLTLHIYNNIIYSFLLQQTDWQFYGPHVSILKYPEPFSP